VARAPALSGFTDVTPAAATVAIGGRRAVAAATVAIGGRRGPAQVDHKRGCCTTDA
jgi:hypothetical protein